MRSTRSVDVRTIWTTKAQSFQAQPSEPTTSMEAVQRRMVCREPKKRKQEAARVLIPLVRKALRRRGWRAPQVDSVTATTEARDQDTRR